MLTYLHLRDFAVVEQLELELDSGLTVLTGETGAGKSILIDALGLALGDRADSIIVRQGKPRTEICVNFDISANEQAQQWLHQHALDNESDCLIRRIITQEGRSRAWINGSPVPLQQLRNLGELLVDIHGQNEHQSLLKRDHQRELLDRVAGHNSLVSHVHLAFKHWQVLQQEYEFLNASIQHKQQLELLRFQVQELETLAISADEIQSLDEEHKRLANTDKLLEGCQQSVAAITQGDTSLSQELARIITIMQEMQQSDPRLNSVVECLNNARIQLDEAGNDLRQHIEGLSLDPERLQQIDQRLGAIHDLARKHRVLASELPQCQQQLSDQLAQLEHAEQRLSVLQQEITQAASLYQKTAAKLTKSRLKCAEKLAREVTQTMQPLGMPDSRFAIDMQLQQKFSRHGLDRIEFLVATNSKQRAQPLNKVASGGELSRISLAIQVITTTNSAIPTLIFDEVDVGIGGRVAEIIGQKLRQLGQQKQILCVTHLPQVAAQGHQHLFVDKISNKGASSTTITLLNKKEQRNEIARMLGGISITAQTRAHAEEMIKNAGRQLALETE